MLVKALPHVGDLHGETVCCAGVTAEREWRRQFPIKFRDLGNEKFKRWQWIEYDWRKPAPPESRPESQRVQEGTIRIGITLPRSRHADFLRPIVLESVEHAMALGQTLALIEPVDSSFSWERKTSMEIEDEAAAFAAASNQLSLFNEDPPPPLEPCPYRFHFRYKTKDGKSHKHTCEDWETSAAFFNLEKEYGENHALDHLDKMFNITYPRDGMVFAMGTHSRYPNTWLLVGVIRLDKTDQLSLI